MCLLMAGFSTHPLITRKEPGTVQLSFKTPALNTFFYFEAETFLMNATNPVHFLVDL